MSPRRVLPAVAGVLLLAGLSAVAPVVASALTPASAGVVSAEDEAGSDPAPEDASSDGPASESSGSSPADDSSANEPASGSSGSSLADDPAADDPAADDPAADDSAADDPQIDGDPAEDDPGVDGQPTDEEVTDEEVTDEEVTDEEVTDEEVTDEEVTGDSELVLDIAQGDGVEVSVAGGGLLAGSRAELWVFSTPRLLSTAIVDEAGVISMAATLPADLPAGSHTVLLKGTDVDGAPVELGSDIEIGPDGELLDVVDNVDVSALETPTLPDDPKAPAYPPVVALDQPASVVSTTIAAVALLSVTGAGVMAASRPGGFGSDWRSAGPQAPELTGGRIDEHVSSSAVLLAAFPVEHNRGWRTKFRPLGNAPGDRSWLYRFPFTSYLDEASFLWPAALRRRSPLLARILDDGAPLRAMVGSASLVLAVAAAILGVTAAVAGDGVAEPPVLVVLTALMVIGVLDAFAGLIGVVTFTMAVAVMGGIIDWASVRTLMGIALLIIGPGLIASSFRDIRRAAPRSFTQWWERAADLVIVPLLGAFTTFNVAVALPPLGGSLFPVAESASRLAWTVAMVLVAKVLLEEAAARWFPERFATVLGDGADPGTLQRAISALVRLGLFFFISAAFVGTSWHLWVGGAIWFVPIALGFLAAGVPNNSRLWQVLPQSLPALGFALLVYLIVAASLGAALGDTPDFALTSFVLVLVPGLILGVLALFGRAPAEGDVRWYLRPTHGMLYRVGGLLVLGATTWLALASLF